ncbi:MAG: hypothetical protein L0332_32015 [Chloroflexi bacterium]|nr:hypothetical protein [Chloroflexota bacterium]MCI0577830.1 hypothetical protein [Chloroflexota bacterium]MCI0646127.1 hypothetical protein [Chloroflexota bacterium]MCI0731329.1 hypothetical protein [Chloroflexota bacterium]
MNRYLPLRMALMAVVLLTLLAALWAGLARLGWALPLLPPTLAAAHGPLMVSGFLGTLIGLERAVALGRRWCYAGPLLSGLGALALVVGLPGPAGPLLMTLGSLALVLVSGVIVRRLPALYTVTMGLGALLWLAGNGLWLAGRPVIQVVYWWGGFLVLTIVGERLELSRVTRPGGLAQMAFGLSVGLFVAGLLLSLALDASGMLLASAGLVALALWLGRYDVARRTVRRPGLARYVAANLLLGYAWLAASGVLGILLYGGVVTGFLYDAWLHTLFLGFVFGMIFAHALIILPAVAGLAIPFHPVFYGPPLLLHLGLLARVAGDLASWWPGRQWGGLLNAVAILWFLLQMVMMAVRGWLHGRAHETKEVLAAWNER